MTSRIQARSLAQRSLIQALSQKNRKRQGLGAGFTLIELLIVVIIIGVLSAIAIPAFLNQQNRARASAANTSVMDAARACAALQVVGSEGSYAAPAGVTGGCPPAGTQSTFTFTPATGASAATATLGANGSVNLTAASVPNP